jgi:hypothetical protein
MASFDTLLDITGSGRECTACMLDLEYLFTESPRVIPRFGAPIHEVDLSGDAANALGGKFLRADWQTRGLGKLHFVCLARDGARLSIDHL